MMFYWALYFCRWFFLSHQIFIPFKMSREINIKVRCKYFIVYEHIFRKSNNNNNTKKPFTIFHRPSHIFSWYTYRYFNMLLKEIASCILTLWVEILMTISAWRSTVVASKINRKGHLFFLKSIIFFLVF